MTRLTITKLIQPLDRLAIATMLILSLLIGFIIWEGDAVKPNVRAFSWQNQQIGADDTSFSLTFSRPMDDKSVEDNLKIVPPLAGKTSWAGRRLVYTLLSPAAYGTSYKLELQGAKDKFSAEEGNKRLIQPFTGSFTTRDRVIAYIGANAVEKGRLVLYDLNQEQKKILTPPNLIVMDFAPFPNREKILFSARFAQDPDLLSTQIYTVTTGITAKATSQTAQPNKIDLILDNKDFQNLKFDLSPDGTTIAIQRGKRDNPGEFGLWYLRLNSDGQPDRRSLKQLRSQPGGDFIITPDSKAVAVAQGQGTAILPLQEDATKPLDFLPQYSLVQAFSKDGSQAAMVKFNTDYTRDVFLVTNQGINKPLIKTKGSILSCQFDPNATNLYCLITQLISKGQYAEQPYLVEINLKTQQQKALLMLPINQHNIHMSISPDNLGLLFDQVVPIADTTAVLPNDTLKTDDGQPIASSSVWFLPLLPFAEITPTNIKPEQLPLPGFNPCWLP
jgi:Tol biopolymer transport system component